MTNLKSITIDGVKYDVPTGGASSWNDLTDKPFYSDGISLTYNGNYEDYENVGGTLDGVSIYFIKVSNEPISYDDVLNASVTAIDGDTEATMPVTEEFILQTDYGLAVADCIQVVTVDSVEMDGFVLTKGIWFMHVLSENTTIICVKALDCGTIKKLDMKYIDTDAIKDIVNDVITEALNSEV